MPNPDPTAAIAPGLIDQQYARKRVLITGGLGFIGSTLAHRLVAVDAEVVSLDALLADSGANPHNIESIRDRVTLRIGDVRDGEALADLVPNAQVIFNLAGALSHTGSMANPLEDLDINCRAQVGLLELCRHRNPDVRIVYAGTRGQYGRPQYLPVDERHPLNAADTNGINKTAGEAYHLLYHEHFGLKASSLRMSNTYGPRHQMRHHRQGVIGWFVRQAMEGGTIKVFGDGRQVRDATYVDDVVDALLLAGARDAAAGQAFNLGSAPIAIGELAEAIVKAAGRGRVELVPYPEASRRVEVGDYVADISKIQRLLGWSPATSLDDGLARTVAFYEQHKSNYW